MMTVLFHVETGNFLFTTASRPGLPPTQPPFQWEPVVSTQVKQLVLNDYHLTASSAEVKNVWGFPRLHNIVLQYRYSFVSNAV
jgi:hypothetical protein